jgi:SAM-dependent methyltransferase
VLHDGAAAVGPRTGPVRCDTARVAPDARWAAAMPQHYDELLGPTLIAPFAVELADRAAGLRPRRMLELAAGTGRVTAELVRRLPGAAVTATDLNEAMVAHGAARVPGAAWQPADAQAPMFFPDRPRAYAECARVLGPVTATPAGAAQEAAR